jgi:ABC-type transport system involved in multi-copper enzyme maturation permease subunit
MTRALRAEWLKLRRTRSLVAVLGVGLVVAVVGTVVLLSVGKEDEIGDTLSGYGPLRFGPTNFGLLLVVLGVRLFADETHHRTLAGTLLRTPHRGRVVAAKVLVAAAAAAAFTVVVYLLVIPVTAAGIALRELDLTYDAARTAALLGRVVVAMVLLTVLGVAVGVLLRSRTVALVAVVLWFALGEDLVGALLKGDRFLPGAAAQSLVSAGSGSAGSAITSALALAVLVAAALLAATLSMRRDVP